MARLYPPITEEALPAFYLTYNSKGEKVGATIKINFNLNRAVANSEISGIALRLKTISTNTLVVSENLAGNLSITSSVVSKSEGYAISYDLDTGVCIFTITNEYNPEAVEKLKVGQYYKAQIAFVNQNEVIGYWSTVASIKCVAKPTIKIANFQFDDINSFSNEIVGEYWQDITMGDYTEKVYSYRFQLFDKDGETILEDTGDKLHNSNKDIESNASVDTYYCYRDLDENEIYYIQYHVKTINGLNLSTPRYQLMNIGSIPPEQDLKLNVFNGLEENYSTKLNWRPWEEGVMEISLDFDYDAPGKKLTGNFVLLRSSSKDNFVTWQEVRRFRLNNTEPSSKIIYDYTIEQGINYKYAIQQYNFQKFYSNKLYQVKNSINKYNKDFAQSIKADFEDMFLYDGKKQLKIRFNPKVSSFKNDLQEQKIDTIGGKYPFIFRNGIVCYKEFPISGLISFQEDNALFFIDNEDYKQMKLERFSIPSNQRSRRGGYEDFYYKEYNDAIQFASFPLYVKQLVNINNSNNINGHEITHRQEFDVNIQQEERYIPVENASDALNYRRKNEQLYQKISKENEDKEKYSWPNDIYRDNTYFKTDLTAENIASERYFKLKVLEWLTDGKPKLFRSPTEGNYIVRLLNVSLTPQDQLGRMIHSFSCTAYEIAEFNYESLVELGLLTVKEPESLEFQWESQNIKFFLSTSNKGKKDKNGDTYYSVDVGEKEIYGFSCTGFMPGDKIKLLVKDDPTPIIITIGQTGSYSYENAVPIISFSVCPLVETKNASRDLFFKLMGYNYQKFDLIASMNLFTRKGEQIVGESPNIFEKVVVNNGHNINNYTYGKNAKKYYEASNVYLSEDFQSVQIDEETYNKNIYYILNPNGTYSFCYSGMEKKPYNQDKIYCKRLFNAPKIVTSDILYLHAKRREIIPIFAYTTTSLGEDGDTIYRLDNKLNKGLIKFQLTPFGNGYLHTKNISPDWEPILYNTLTEKERTMALTVEDLVTFTINKCNLDIFCLFEVYVPKKNEEDNSLEWQSYKNLNIETSYSGIFDPYLYQKIGNGWWTEDKIYDPSFIIGFGEDKNYHEETISLQDKIEITLKNIELPTYLSNGTGIMMEIFYRLKYIDYTIENTEPIVKNKKKILLSAISTAQQKKALYRTQSYYQTINSNLTEKEKQTWAAIVNSSEEYADTIEKITELARTAQITTIKNYLNKESAAMRILLNQCQTIDQNLKDTLGSSNFIFYNKLNTVKTNYFNYISQTLNKSNNDLLPSLSKYKNGTATIPNTEDKLYRYYNNNSSSIISVIQQQILKNILQSGYEDCKKEIILLDDKQYVAQYLELLEDKAKKIFFQIPSDIQGEEEVITWIQNYNIAEWINKQNGYTVLRSNVDIFDDEVWNEYFHIDDSFMQLNSVYQDEETKAYIIDNLEIYLNPEENGFNQNSKIFTEKFQDNKTLLQIINEKLEQLNNEHSITESEYQDIWKIAWTSTIPESFELFSEEINSQINLMGLGKLDYNSSSQTYSINKSTLEEQIDNAFGLGQLSYNSTTQDILNFLNENMYGKDFPPKLKEKLSDIIYVYIHDWREYFQNITGFIDYLSNSQNKERLSKEQVEFIQNELKKYYNEINNSDSSWYQKLNLRNNSSDFWKFYNLENNISFKKWYNDYNGITDGSSVISNSINEIMEYVNIFNQILEIKQNAIQEFKTLKTKIDNLKNKSGLKPSDNIKIILYEEQDAYQNAYYEVEQALNYFKNRQEKLKIDYDYNSYLEFLNDYLTFGEITKQSSIDKNYRQFIQKASLVTQVESDNAPSVQDNNVAEAWKEFLKVLASTYKKIEEKGKIS